MKDILDKIRGMIQNTPSLNIREKARMFLVFKKYTVLMYAQEGKLYNPQIRRLAVESGKIMEHCNARRRRQELKSGMIDHRAKQGVFYLCSWHINPAEDHKNWEGKIYVDRFWKNILKDDIARMKAVEAYVRNRNIRTVQWVTGKPVYMITRPYCRHYMTGLDTDEVLKASLKKIKKNHTELQSEGRRYDWKEKFYRFRREAHRAMEMIPEMKWDEKIIKKRQSKIFS